MIIVKLIGDGNHNNEHEHETRTRIYARRRLHRTRLRRDGVQGMECRSDAQPVVGSDGGGARSEGAVVDEAARFVYDEEVQKSHRYIILYKWMDGWMDG